jgi:chromosome segregation ATPase
MSFKEGFTAIEHIKSSGQKLSDTVAKIETLETKLEALLHVQSQLEAALEKATSVFGNLETSSADLSKNYKSFTEQAGMLPNQVEAAIERAEERILEQHAQMTTILDALPQLVEKALEQKLNTKLVELETRFSDRLRDELKDTRLTMRDAMEVNSRSQETKLETAVREIMSAMPRSLFGRRGK